MNKILSNSIAKNSRFLKSLVSSYLQKFSSFNKICSSPQEALKDVTSGSQILFGGYGLCGIPENSIYHLSTTNIKDIHAISNDSSVPNFGLGMLIQKEKIKRLTCAFIKSNLDLEMRYLQGKIELELIPAGTLSEKLRAGGAGIPGFYTPTGIGTMVEHGGIPIKYKKPESAAYGAEPEIVSEPKERKEFNGRPFLFEESIKADFAIIKGWKADTKGNVVFNYSARNFNEDMAKAAKYTICEVEEIVEPGDIDARDVHIPGIYIDKVFRGNFEKRVNRLMLNRGESWEEHPFNEAKRQKFFNRTKIIKRAVKELKNGMYVNLGVGIPAYMPHYIPNDIEVELQCENGILGYGDYPKPGFHNPEIINQGSETVTIKPGAAFMGSADAFSIIRGGHLDLIFLGAYQVSNKGDIASWTIPGVECPGMGSAMDLSHTKDKVIILMQHTAKGANRILDKCTYPITAPQIAKKIITELGVFEFHNDQLVLTEIAEETNLETVRGQTCEFVVAENLKKF